ncbi:MAG: (Fe-S)-binding protein [Longimicrobiales bacterium]|nr:(Fe-S)-binding protein [Longimicrobiales bacterium]
MRVALFATCLGDRLFADACADAVRLLRKLGVEVDYPAGQSCCGQPALNAGHVPEARRMALHTVAALDGADYVVLPSGSCAGMLRTHYPALLGSAAARDLAQRTYELSQFVVRVLGVSSVGHGLEGRTVAYHHGCHALRELRVRDEPLALLEGAGARVVPWEAAEECCGFGGLFSVKLPSVSVGMADRKLDTLPRADVVTSADGGCLMQLSARAAHRGLDLSFRHLSSVLWDAAS